VQVEMAQSSRPQQKTWRMDLIVGLKFSSALSF
jgi:hypothetical protein